MRPQKALRDESDWVAATWRRAATQSLSSRRAHFSSAFALWSRKDWRRNLIVCAFAGLASVWHKQPQGDTRWSESRRAARRFALDPFPERCQAMREKGYEGSWTHSVCLLVRRSDSRGAIIKKSAMQCGPMGTVSSLGCDSIASIAPEEGRVEHSHS